MAVEQEVADRSASDRCHRGEDDHPNQVEPALARGKSPADSKNDDADEVEVKGHDPKVPVV